MKTRLLAMLACVAAALAGRPAAAEPMHCAVTDRSAKSVGPVTMELGRFEGDIDSDSLGAPVPGQWALGGEFRMFGYPSARAVRRGRFALIDIVLGGNPFLELVLDRRAPRAWIRAYVFPDGRVRVLEWRADCTPMPIETGLPPPPPSLVAEGSTAPTSGPLVPHDRVRPGGARLWLIGRRAPAEIVR